jgi:hypothetical protein
MRFPNSDARRGDGDGAPDPVGVPRTEAEARQAGQALGMSIPDACMPGVIATLAGLDVHVAILMGSDRPAGR